MGMFPKPQLVLSHPGQVFLSLLPQVSELHPGPRPYLNSSVLLGAFSSYQLQLLKLSLPEG